MSVFEQYKADAYPYVFKGSLKVGCLVGGIPSDPNVAEGWLRSKLAPKDDLIREMVAQVMVEREVTVEEATEIVNSNQHVNGFKRLRPSGQLYIEGRQLKAAIKEAGNVAAAADKIKKRGWTGSNKGVRSLIAEHIFVTDATLPLTFEDGTPVTEPTGIAQRFVHTFRGNSIQYEEYVENAVVNFTIITDQDLTEKDWAMLWLTGQQQGIGATRSQGFGVYEVIAWERVTGKDAKLAREHEQTLQTIVLPSEQEANGKIDAPTEETLADALARS